MHYQQKKYYIVPNQVKTDVQFCSRNKYQQFKIQTVIASLLPYKQTDVKGIFGACNL